MTIVDISKFTNTTTVAEIKKILTQVEQNETASEKEYRDFLESFIGKYIFCKHTDTNGFVAKLTRWNADNDVISIKPSGFLYERVFINKYWVYHPYPSSCIDCIKTITEEQYLEIDRVAQEVQRLRNSITLFK